MAAGYVLLSITVVVVTFPLLSEQCATNGLCGYNPSCGGGYQPPPSCSCAQRGYSCGSYGCYRHRVRGAKSYQPHRSRSRSSTSMESDRDVLRQRIVPMGAGDPDRVPEEELINQLVKERLCNEEPLTESEELDFVSRSVARNRNSATPVDPNRAFMECCMDRHLPDACLSKCNFNTYNKQSLTAMYFKQDACPLAAMKEMQFCAAQGRDHTECCARNGVTTTLAGAKCLTFCDQRLGKATPLDMSYVPCFDRFENMKSCFWHDLTRYYKH